MLQQYSIVGGRIAHSPDGSTPVDVYVLPNDEERSHLINDLGIDEHTLRSATDPDETPRIEFDSPYIAIILKYPKNYSAEDNFLFLVKSMGIFMFSDRVVVVVDENVPLFLGKIAANVHTVQDVVLRLLMQTIRHFESHLRVINMCSDEIENELIESRDNKSLLDMFTLEKGLVYYVNALSGNRRVLERIRAGAAKFNFSEDNIELLEDLQVENSQFLDQATINSQVLSGLMDARASIINNNLNVMMKNMNAIVIAVAVPTFFTGVFGMSEFTMMTKEYWYFAYPIFVAFMILLGVFAFWLIKKYERH
ncbi:MAG: magnesium transporter CorA family protein [Lentisphaeria bacterium]|nr:magnesium transporter CorA family protein [Lentisphaeria bacterium]